MRGMIVQLRLMLAERMLAAAMMVAPPGPERWEMAVLIRRYFETVRRGLRT